MTATHPPDYREETFAKEAAERFERDGFCLAQPVFSPDQIDRTVAGMDAVMRGEYDTGRKPFDCYWNPDDAKTKLRKIDQPHFANRAIYEAITDAAFARTIAAIIGARMLQVWAVQLLYKPPGGDAKSSVGWHQDYFYWKTTWKPESNVFTAWLALSDVREECGPMHFAVGSHRWGLLNAGDFFAPADSSQQKNLPVPPGEKWIEASGAIPAGAFSLHHRFTFHGSQPNVSNIPRYSLAIHMRTEKSVAIPRETTEDSYDYAGHLDNPDNSPIIYRADGFE